MNQKIASGNKLAKDSSFVRYSHHNEQSKMDNLLGRGLVADILLWKDEKRTFLCFVSLIISFYWFFLCGRALISAVADLLFLVAVLLYGHGFLPSNLFGITMKRISTSSFSVSGISVKDPILNVTCVWNKGIQVLKTIVLERDFSMLLKVVSVLYFVKLVASCSFTNILFIASVLPFMAFFVYEQHGPEMDSLLFFLLKWKDSLVCALRRMMNFTSISCWIRNK